MTGMDEMPDGRPLTLDGWPGKGVSAGDEGKLLYTQHTGRAARDYGGEHKNTFIQTNAFVAISLSLFLKSFSCSSCCFNVPFHPH